MYTHINFDRKCNLVICTFKEVSTRLSLSDLLSKDESVNDALRGIIIALDTDDQKVDITKTNIQFAIEYSPTNAETHGPEDLHGIRLFMTLLCNRYDERMEQNSIKKYILENTDCSEIVIPGMIPSNPNNVKGLVSFKDE